MSLNSKDPQLDEALAVLRKAYTQEPPAHVESFLMAHMNGERRRKAMRIWRAAAAFAAALTLLAWLTTRHNAPGPETAPITSGYETRAASPPPEEVAPPVRTAQVTATRQPKRVAAQRRQVHAGTTPEDPSMPDPFLAIPYTEPLLPFEQLDIYRVQLPRATLNVYGFPARAGGPESPVTAEVAVGSDGVVRAVRLVR
jgi:hypothetical protein